MKRTNFEEILMEVRNYQKDADRIFTEYHGKVSRMKEELNEKTFLQKMKAEVYPHYSGTLMGLRTAAKSNIHATCETIADDLRSWMLKPVKPETMQILSCIKNFNLKLTKDELSVLEADVRDNMFAGKIFGAIARDSGYSAELPDATKYLRALRTAENDAYLAVDAYAGAAPGFIGKDLLDQHRVNGVAVGEWQFWHRMYAFNYESKHSSLNEAAKLWENSKVSVQYTLTADERKRLEKIMNEVNKMDESAKADKILSLMQSEPDFQEKLKLMGGDYEKMAYECSAGRREG